MEVEENLEMVRVISGTVVKEGAKGRIKLAIKWKELKGQDELKKTLLMTSQV